MLHDMPVRLSDCLHQAARKDRHLCVGACPEPALCQNCVSTDLPLFCVGVCLRNLLLLWVAGGLHCRRAAELRDGFRGEVFQNKSPVPVSHQSGRFSRLPCPAARGSFARPSLSILRIPSARTSLSSNHPCTTSPLPLFLGIARPPRKSSCVVGTTPTLRISRTRGVLWMCREAAL
jgi:hypothetical protein